MPFSASSFTASAPVPYIHALSDSMLASVLSHIHLSSRLSPCHPFPVPSYLLSKRWTFYSCSISSDFTDFSLIVCVFQFCMVWSAKKGMLWIGELVKPVTIEKSYPHLEFDGGSCIENSRGVLCGQRLDRNVDVWDSVWCGKSILKRVQLEFTIFKTIIISWISLIDKIK